MLHRTSRRRCLKVREIPLRSVVMPPLGTIHQGGHGDVQRQRRRWRKEHAELHEVVTPTLGGSGHRGGAMLGVLLMGVMARWVMVRLSMVMVRMRTNPCCRRTVIRGGVVRGRRRGGALWLEIAQWLGLDVALWLMRHGRGIVRLRLRLNKSAAAMVRCLTPPSRGVRRGPASTTTGTGSEGGRGRPIGWCADVVVALQLLLWVRRPRGRRRGACWLSDCRTTTAPWLLKLTLSDLKASDAYGPTSRGDERGVGAVRMVPVVAGRR